MELIGFFFNLECIKNFKIEKKKMNNLERKWLKDINRYNRRKVNE